MIACDGTFNNLRGNASKKLDILKIVKEDVLRALCERRRKTSLEIIKDEIKVAHALISEALEELERDGLIAIQENLVLLTGLGQESAKNILKKHFVLENYFEKTRSKLEAHTTAHILEHYVSGEVINNIKKLSTLKKEGIPLTKFELNKEGMITDITFSDYGLFERIVSMGIFLGEKITITNEISHGIVVKIKNKKFALDKNIAEEIKVVEHEKP
ncbi:MAG: FeoA domain-containing protein [Candidatus Bathyarchaeota archaeon]|jgi:Mn-dependent DtxR family transcriptional regulator